MVPKVSVAIVTFNHDKFIEQCIESVLNQDYPNLEIIVSDDCSIDNTVSILYQYKKKYPEKIKVIISEVNYGITINSNKAFFSCTGDFICLLGGDDMMLPNKISKQVNFFKKNLNYAICYHNMEIFQSETNQLLGYTNSGFKSVKPRTGGVETLVKFGTYLCASSVMLRTSACPPHGFNTRIKFSSDWLFLVETALNGKVGYIPEVLGRYRRHESNITKITPYLGEELITLNIIREKYPFLEKYCNEYYSRYLYMQAVRKIQVKEGAVARNLFVASLKCGWVSWKLFVWFLLSYFN